MVDYADLYSAKLDQLAEDAAAWSKVARELEDIQEAFVKGVVARIEWGGWKGSAARAALAYNDKQHQRLNDASVELGNITVGLQTAHENFNQAYQELQGAVREAATDPRVTKLVKETGYLEGPQNVINGHISAMNKAVNDATTADTETAKLLNRLAKAAEQLDDPGGISDKKLQQHSRAAIAVEGGVEVDGSPLKLPNPSPQQVAKWWGELSPIEREQVLEAYPELVGQTNGISAVDRDEANRHLMANKLEQLRGNQNLSEHEQQVLQGLGAVEKRLGQQDANLGGPGYYMLGLDTEGDGKAMVAVGNPDEASHTSVYVPGEGATLGNYGTHLDRAAALQAEAGAMTQPPGDTSVVAWMGYDAPDSGPGDAGNVAAQQAGKELNRFLGGLRAVHENITVPESTPPSEEGPRLGGVGPASQSEQQRQHVTVVGHGYGGAVIGEAAKQGELPADDVVVTGSTGMNVNSAEQLDVGSDHVWSGTAPNDRDARWDIHDRHGTDPRFEGFDANRFRTGEVGHDGYYQQDSESLRNQARVIAGRHDQVRQANG